MLEVERGKRVRRGDLPGPGDAPHGTERVMAFAHGAPRERAEQIMLARSLESSAAS
jgi:hypothetical protein